MKNLYISIALFILLNIFILCSINYLNGVCSDLVQVNDTITITINKNSWDEAEILAKKFKDDWLTHSKNLSIFVDHKEMDQINVELYKLIQYVHEKNSEEALASSNVINFFLGHIKQMEEITPQNIF